jgi:hypothetical protein
MLSLIHYAIKYFLKQLLLLLLDERIGLPLYWWLTGYLTVAKSPEGSTGSLASGARMYKGRTG